ncbi:hypothetical protein, partial [Falsiroseomonas sp. E2-1-a20]|uniref:hypothetical protein n=1 Tax=Falsiroseomonas sp. E2-1-a20 TaxID=3239300 RepID=UPI003F376070
KGKRPVRLKCSRPHILTIGQVGLAHRRTISMKGTGYVSDQIQRPTRPDTPLRRMKTASDYHATLIAYYAALHPDAPSAEVEREADDAITRLGEAFYLALFDIGVTEQGAEGEPSAASEPRLRLLAAISTLVPLPSQSEMQQRRKAKAGVRRRRAEERRVDMTKKMRKAAILA